MERASPGRLMVMDSRSLLDSCSGLSPPPSYDLTIFMNSGKGEVDSERRLLLKTG